MSAKSTTWTTLMGCVWKRNWKKDFYIFSIALHHFWQQVQHATRYLIWKGKKVGGFKSSFPHRKLMRGPESGVLPIITFSLQIQFQGLALKKFLVLEESHKLGKVNLNIFGRTSPARGHAQRQPMRCRQSNWSSPLCWRSALSLSLQWTSPGTDLALLSWMSSQALAVRWDNHILNRIW